jgi:hypothetical protein
MVVVLLGPGKVPGLLDPGKVPGLLGPDRFVDMVLGLFGRALVVAGECFGIHFQVAIASFRLELGLAVRNSDPSLDCAQFQDLGHLGEQ